VLRDFHTIQSDNKNETSTYCYGACYYVAFCSIIIYWFLLLVVIALVMGVLAYFGINFIMETFHFKDTAVKRESNQQHNPFQYSSK
jgi:hypothetical protein